eukprot:m.159943 g.159943  ORF g.159943 m.159943 type:complete len:318 (+) comp15161_c0_seq5:36-989(+)
MAKKAVKRQKKKASTGLSNAAVIAALISIGIGCLIAYYASDSDNNAQSRKRQPEESKQQQKSHTVLSTASESKEDEFWSLPCAPQDEESFCKGNNRCGRLITDALFDEKDLFQLVNMAKKWMVYGEGSGGPTILDLHSGALSLGERFIDVYSEVKRKKDEVYDADDFAVYNRIKNTVKAMVERQFHVSENSIYLTNPTFFSSITSKPAKTLHDEYWHEHVDKITYGNFDFTCLLYLATYNEEFTGGEFQFVNDTNLEGIQPRNGRLACFSSGEENTHRVTRVESGRRFALTMGFTCDKTKAIAEPDGKRAVAHADNA